MLEEIQGFKPEEAVIVLGDNNQDHFRISAYYSYFLSLKQQFLNKQACFVADLEMMPDPALNKDHGMWGNYANELMEKSLIEAGFENIVTMEREPYTGMEYKNRRGYFIAKKK